MDSSLFSILTIYRRQSKLIYVRHRFIYVLCFTSACKISKRKAHSVRFTADRMRFCH
ncbi:hypothetical protein CLOHYLEM_06967 [[Clostridium] hylemonae DSM 15053]|uniref:Uncharacterized protein n=1 Tax=[Clostridium] hylemonae DSM 15053 TaxID=553973 RepID=C0C4F1_9FIRM|nr:hypothetical protein CLOHYLEM_06967 [[Clostridium] hylemonae DSM 15053]